MKEVTKPIFDECGCCEHWHPTDFYGDCRDDANRFTAQELDERYGEQEWQEGQTIEEAQQELEKLGATKLWGQAPEESSTA